MNKFYLSLFLTALTLALGVMEVNRLFVQLSCILSLASIALCIYSAISGFIRSAMEGSDNEVSIWEGPTEAQMRENYDRNIRECAAAADNGMNSSRYVDYDGNLIEYRTGENLIMVR